MIQAIYSFLQRPSQCVNDIPLQLYRIRAGRGGYNLETLLKSGCGAIELRCSRIWSSFRVMTQSQIMVTLQSQENVFLLWSPFFFFFFLWINAHWEYAYAFYLTNLAFLLFSSFSFTFLPSPPNFHTFFASSSAVIQFFLNGYLQRGSMRLF